MAAAASFAAGTAVGLVAPAVLETALPAEPVDASERYARDLTERYRLSAEQHRLVRMALEARDRAHMRILLRDLDRLPAALRLEVLDANRRAEERIKYVLTEEQRQRFLRESELAPLTDGTERDGAPQGAASAQDR